MHNKTKALLAALAAVPLMIALFTACSSTAPSADTTKTDRPGSSKITDLGDWQLAYAKCMRAEGIDYPDPSADGRQTSSNKQDQGTLSAASKKCVGKLGDAPTAPGQKKQSQQEVLADQLKIAQCFRDNGVDTPDPTAKSGVVIPADAAQDVITKCVGAKVPAGSQMATVG
ncbi:MAG: hypothetical protein ABI130_04145 [Leifsonia sp.]